MPWFEHSFVIKRWLLVFKFSDKLSHEILFWSKQILLILFEYSSSRFFRCLKAGNSVFVLRFVNLKPCWKKKLFYYVNEKNIKQIYSGCYYGLSMRLRLIL